MRLYNSGLIGAQAERLAQSYLITQGFTLIQQNYRCFHGEIDLVMQDKNDIVFVEVRKRSNTQYGNAIESITESKVKKLNKAAMHFLQLKQWLYKVNSRFDIVAIHTIAGETQLEWIKNAFQLLAYK